MRTEWVRIKMGRLAGTIQRVPAAVAARLLERGDVDPAASEDLAAVEALTGGRDVQVGRKPRTHRDPRVPLKE